MPIHNSPYENKSKEEIECIRERQKQGHRRKLENMTEKEREAFRGKKRYANKMSRISRQKKKEKNNGN